MLSIMHFFTTPELDVELTPDAITVYVLEGTKLPVTLCAPECTVTVNEKNQVIFNMNRDLLHIYDDTSKPTLVLKDKVESRQPSSLLVEKNEPGVWEDQVVQDTQTDVITFPSCILENVEKREPGAPPSAAWSSMDTPEGIFKFSQLMAGASGSGIEAHFETDTQEGADKMNELMGSIADGPQEIENITFDLENGEVSSEVLSSNP